MRTVMVQRVLHAPAERVFDVLVDHEGYERFPGVISSKLTREGAGERNGVGAQRDIDVGLLRVTEEITSFERPMSFEYRIVKSRPPIEHELGKVSIEPASDGVRVTWLTRFKFKIPLIGWIMTALAAKKMERSLQDALRVTELLAR